MLRLPSRAGKAARGPALQRLLRAARRALPEAPLPQVSYRGGLPEYSLGRGLASRVSCSHAGQPPGRPEGRRVALGKDLTPQLPDVVELTV